MVSPRPNLARQMLTQNGGIARLAPDEGDYAACRGVPPLGSLPAHRGLCPRTGHPGWCQNILTGAAWQSAQGRPAAAAARHGIVDAFYQCRGTGPSLMAADQWWRCSSSWWMRSRHTAMAIISTPSSPGATSTP